jgi:hypothetical protein
MYSETRNLTANIGFGEPENSDDASLVIFAPNLGTSAGRIRAPDQREGTLG